MSVVTGGAERCVPSPEAEAALDVLSGSAGTGGVGWSVAGGPVAAVFPRVENARIEACLLAALEDGRAMGAFSAWSEEVVESRSSDRISNVALLFGARRKKSEWCTVDGIRSPFDIHGKYLSYPS